MNAIDIAELLYSIATVAVGVAIASVLIYFVLRKRSPAHGQVKRRSWRRWARDAFVLLALPAIYVGSLGPASCLQSYGMIDADTVKGVYFPLTAFCSAYCPGAYIWINKYIRLWNPRLRTESQRPAPRKVKPDWRIIYRSGRHYGVQAAKNLLRSGVAQVAEKPSIARDLLPRRLPVFDAIEQRPDFDLDHFRMASIAWSERRNAANL